MKVTPVFTEGRKCSNVLSTAAAAAAQRTPGKDDDALLRTGRLFGGLIKDVQRKFPHYKSDFIDAFKNFKCLVTFIFVYFATIAPCVTYGGLLSKKTDGWIGLSESILATALGGILFGFCSGQPLMIVGVTGPVLVFEETIYNVSYYMPPVYGMSAAYCNHRRTGLLSIGGRWG